MSYLLKPAAEGILSTMNLSERLNVAVRNCIRGYSIHGHTGPFAAMRFVCHLISEFVSGLFGRSDWNKTVKRVITVRQLAMPLLPAQFIEDTLKRCYDAQYDKRSNEERFQYIESSIGRVR